MRAVLSSPFLIPSGTTRGNPRVNSRRPWCQSFRAGGLAAAVLALLAWLPPLAAEEPDRQGEGPGAQHAAEMMAEEVTFSQAMVTMVDSYMVGLKAIHRWREMVAPVTGRLRSRLLRRELGGSHNPDLLLAGQNWRQGVAALEGAEAPTEQTARLREALLHGGRIAGEALAEFRLVGAELDPVLFGSGSARLCFANRKVLQAATDLRSLLRTLAIEGGATAEALTFRGADLQLHMAYLEAKGCLWEPTG